MRKAVPVGQAAMLAVGLPRKGEAVYQLFRFVGVVVLILVANFWLAVLVGVLFRNH
jgi:hypothetical protein